MTDELLTWRVAQDGREAHLVDLHAGYAVCGQPGTNWRKVAGADRCGQCAKAAGQ